MSDSEKYQQVKEKVNKWYDEDLYVKRRVVNAKAKSLCKNPYDNSFRNSYFKHYREYKKLVKYKKKHYTKSILGKLDELECNDPKSYWNLVNSLKNENENTSKPETSIDAETWFEYFQKLNSVKTKFHDRLESLHQFLTNPNQTRTFNLLDTLIKEKEIFNCISKLKNNKAFGLDSIRNEMLKAGATILMPCMNKLFNLSLSSENYRGITITSNLGKLFNMVLNARLDTFLEDNEIINKEQIGFTRKARTSDHMFV